MRKKVIYILLIVMLLMGLCPTQQIFAGEEAKKETTGKTITVYRSTEEAFNNQDIITRAEWIRNLNVIFQFSVEEDNFPDNYFSDLTSDSEYYKDVLLAVEFGVIDLEAGEPFYPDNPATREFAAQTMNNCLRFEREEEGNYSFSDVNQVSYPDEDQIAVNRGWFELIEGEFCPTMAVTSAEAEKIFKDAEAVWESTDVEKSYDSSFVFADNVVEVPDETEVLQDGKHLITIINSPVEIKQGDSFAVYINGLPQVYEAVSVSKDGNNLIIDTMEEDQEDAFVEVDAQGEVEGDLSLAQPEGDTTITYVTGGTAERDFFDGQEYASPKAAGNVPLSAVRFHKTLNLDRGISVEVSCTLSDLKIEYKINLGEQEAYVGLDGTATMNCSGKFDGMDAVGLPSSLTLGYIPVGGVGNIQISVDFSMGGQLTLSLVEDFSAGVQYKDGFRLVQNFQKKSFSVAAEASIRSGATVSLNVDAIPVVDGSIYASIGVKGNIAANTYDDGKKPEMCIHFSAYMYANLGGRINIDFIVVRKSFSKEIEIYNINNSPIRVVLHYEDNIQVPRCTRGWETGFFTPWDSKYGSNGRSYGSSTGVDKDGNPFTIFEYTVDENGNATITDYNGNVSALMIPSVLDGYTVTGIGRSAIAARKELFTIVVPDTVTEIDDSAFTNNSNLENILFSNNLKKLGSNAFQNCINLLKINLPEGLEEIEYGAFSNCTELKTAYIPTTIKDTGSMGAGLSLPGAFGNCGKLTDITFGGRRDSRDTGWTIRPMSGDNGDYDSRNSDKDRGICV